MGYMEQCKYENFFLVEQATFSAPREWSDVLVDRLDKNIGNEYVYSPDYGDFTDIM
jgi:hypothetical protein